MIRSWFNRNQNTREERFANPPSNISSNAKGQILTKQPNSIHEAFGIGKPKNPHHEDLHPQNHQLAPAQEQRSEEFDDTSQATRSSGFENNHKEGERRERVPTLEELRPEFENFKRDDCSAPHFPGVIQYVHALQAMNKELTRSCKKAQSELGHFGNEAMSLILKLHPPGFEEEMEQRNQYSVGGALKFLQNDYESLWEEYCRNCKEIKRLDGENKDLREELKSQVVSHRKQLSEITNTQNNLLQGERSTHRVEKEQMKALHEKEIQEARSEVENLKLEKGDLIADLTDKHNEALADLRAKLEKDIAALQRALMGLVDRFNPASDFDLSSQFDALKRRVGVVARSPINVNPVELGERLNQAAFIQLADKMHHKFALESSIWAILFDELFVDPFKVFGDYTSLFSTLWSQLARENQKRNSSHVEPLDSVIFVEKWRCTNFEVLSRAVAYNTTELPAYEMIRESYKKNGDRIFQSLSAMFSCVSSQDRQKDIHKILEMACSLAICFGQQRFRVKLFIPSLKHKVSRHNTRTYDDVNKDNDPNLAEGVVQLVVSPGLRKTGDGRGGSLDKEYDLSPAAVYLTETG